MSTSNLSSAPFNQLWGDSTDNTISVPSGDFRYTAWGLGGNDTLIALGVSVTGNYFYGGSGKDYIQAGNISGDGLGRNLLDGGSGADTMIGGVGRDSFYVGARGDVVQDQTAGDGDTVLITLPSYKLPAHIENLTQFFDGDFTGRGNALDNDMRGGTGNVVLRGLAGNDTLEGGFGATTAVLVGGSGADRLLNRTRFEEHVTIFRYDRVTDSNRAFGQDRIAGLDADDLIDFSRIDANSTTVDMDDSFEFIGDDAFSTDATGQVRYQRISDKQFVILVSTDADPAAEMRIIVLSSPPPTETNFIL
jgi:Ca2+-binding RTX toxin-like protein